MLMPSDAVSATVRSQLEAQPAVPGQACQGRASPKSPPGPGLLGMVGLLAKLRQDPLSLMKELVDTYGDIVHFRLPTAGCCILNRSDLTEEVLLRQPERFTKGEESKLLRAPLGNGLLTSEGCQWQQQRQVSGPAFRPDMFQGYGEAILDELNSCLSFWSANEPIEIHREMMRLTGRIGARVFLGTDRLDLVEEAIRLHPFISLQYARNAFAPVRIPFWFPTPGNILCWRRIKRLQSIISEIVRSRARDTSSGEDFLGRHLSQYGTTSRELPPRELLDQARTILVAAYESTALALAWCVYRLARHPNLADQIASEAASVGQGKTLSVSDVPQLVHLKRFLLEVLRLHSPAWALTRTATQNVSIGGYEFPARTRFLILPELLHRDARYYDDARSFSPDRWDEAAQASPPRGAYLPFGLGRRSCIAAKFAMVEMALIVASLASGWRFRLVSPEPIQLKASVTLQPRDGIHVRIEHRDSGKTLHTTESRS